MVVALVFFAEVVHAVLAVVLQVQVSARDPDEAVELNPSIFIMSE